MSRTRRIGRPVRGVSIAGVGCSVFGDVCTDERVKGLTWRELWTTAVTDACADAGVATADVDMFLLGNYLGMDMLNHGCKYGTASYFAGMDLTPGVEFASACSTTNVGLQLAAGMVASGMRDLVLVSGVEVLNSRIKDLDPTDREADMRYMRFRTSCGYDPAFIHSNGSVPGFNALLNLAYAREYGIERPVIEAANAQVAINQRANAVGNPKAFHYGAETMESVAAEAGYASATDYLCSEHNPYVQWPLRSSDNLTVADGASAYLVCASEAAGDYAPDPVDVVGMGSSAHLPTFVDTHLAPHDAEAFRQAYEMAGVTGADLDCLSVHDAVTACTYITAEVGGYLDAGEGYKATLEGRTRADGDRPLSASGGRSGFGHCWTASGGAEVYEAVKQMRGDAPTPLSRRPELYGIHSLGSGELSSVMILQARS